jgi:hypothetical protein
MNQEEINKDADGVVFEGSVAVPAPSSSSVFLSEQKNGFRVFFRPLFKKLPSREAAYWLIFSSVSIFCTGMILVFINSFIEETERYQREMTSVGRYRSLHENMEENGANFSIAEKTADTAVAGN